MRSAGFLGKVICRLRSPLASLPETRHLTSTRESLRYRLRHLGLPFHRRKFDYGVQHTVHSAVEGDIAEFGTHTGRTTKVIATAMQLYRADKSLHLFDSFEGMPEAHAPANLDNEHVKLGVWGRGQFKGASPEQLRAWCANFRRFCRGPPLTRNIYFRSVIQTMQRPATRPFFKSSTASLICSRE